jgi:pyruvate formate lyase activating enzyme
VGNPVITGVIFDIKRYAIHDGPGIRTTVFFKGCPLACRWCHNPESQSAAAEMILRAGRCIGCKACLAACARGAISWSDAGPVTDRSKCVACGDCALACYPGAREHVGRVLSVEETMAPIERDRPFYEESGGGVTFSGGEPLAQPEFLGALLAACRAAGIHTALDTCGYAPWEVIDRIRGDVDLFLYDLKLLDDERHRELTGVSNRLILDNLRELSARGQRIVLRLPVIPGVNDDPATIDTIGAFAKSLPHLEEIDILPYNRMGIDKYARLDRPYRLAAAAPFSDETMRGIAGRLGALGLPVRVGG